MSRTTVENNHQSDEVCCKHTVTTHAWNVGRLEESEVAGC